MLDGEDERIVYAAALEELLYIHRIQAPWRCKRIMVLVYT